MILDFPTAESPSKMIFKSASLLRSLAGAAEPLAGADEGAGMFEDVVSPVWVVFGFPGSAIPITHR